jgi:hypothetical protein
MRRGAFVKIRRRVPVADSKDDLLVEIDVVDAVQVVHRVAELPNELDQDRALHAEMSATLRRGSFGQISTTGDAHGTRGAMIGASRTSGSARPR